MEYYDEYVSLGGNCEIGFQFRRYGKEPSSLFTWLVSDIDKIIKVLSNDFKDFYEFEDLVPYAHDMVKSINSGFSFHSRIHSKYNPAKKKFEFIKDENTRREFFKKEKSKYNYLIEKWNKLSQSNLRVAYFIKDTCSYTESQILKLEKVILEKNPNHKFKLVVIREGNVKVKKNLSENVDICHLNFFSDKKYPAVQIIDLSAWDIIYSYYPLKERIVENMDWIRQECRFLKNDNYSLSMNYNLSQFSEKVDFLDTAKHFITLAKEQSSEKFIEEEYSRINRKIENRVSEERDRYNQHMKTIYSIDSEKDMKSYFIEHDLLAWKYDNKPLEIKVNRETRYIRLSLQEKICFHLDEIEVYNLKNENIALNKSLMMSSTYKQEKPLLNQKALNGKVTGKPSFHTKTENNPWVLLDLEDYEQVTYIKIFNRQGEYSTRALSILVEVSNDLKEWMTVFDNFKIFKKINNNVLSTNQQNILEKIKNSRANVINSEPIELVLQSLLNLSGTDRGMDISKIIKYVLLLQVKAYYQIKVDVSKSSSPKNELTVVNSVVRTFYGNKLVFSLEKGLEKRIFYNNSSSSISNNIKEKVLDFLNIFEKYDVNSEKHKILKYAILSKYKAISRLTGELKQSKDKEDTNRLITKGIELIYGKGYVLTQHGIKKNIDTNYSLEDKIKIVKGMNRLFKILKENLNIDAYIVSGTLLGAVRENEFISYDDDFDTAYISNEVFYPNIWIETLQIIDVLPFKVNPIVGGLLHVKVDLDIVFKLDLFTGWIEDDYFYRYPLPQRVLKEGDVRPLAQTTLYGETIPIPSNTDAILSNNYGENWRKPDPTWRFDWKKANEDYEGKLISLKEKVPERTRIFDSLPILVNDLDCNKSNRIVIKSLVKGEIKLVLSQIDLDNKNVTIVFEKYFLDLSDIQHQVLIDFIYENLNYNIRFKGRINQESVVVTIRRGNKCKLKKQS